MNSHMLLRLRSGVVSTGSHTSAVKVSAACASGLSYTRPMLRPRAPKANPNETKSGQFDRSFERLTQQIEDQLPLSERNVLRGNLHDRLFGEESAPDLRRAAEKDLHGREEEKTAAKVVRSYFSDEDLSPEALHVRSPHLKVAQHVQRQHYDKSLLNTSKESTEYYYEPLSPQQQQRRRLVHASVALGCAIGTYYAFSLFGSYMRTTG